MKKRLLSIMLTLYLSLTLLPGTVCAVTAQPELSPDVAEKYLNILKKNEAVNILKNNNMYMPMEYETSILKQDDTPFLDATTGTVAFLDVTGDNVPELLFITYDFYPDLQAMTIKYLNIYNSEGKLLFQGEVNYNAVLSHTEYAIYKFEDSYDLYCSTGFGEGSESSETYKRLTMQNGQIIEHVLELRTLFWQTYDEINEYYYDEAQISESKYMEYLNAWTSKPKQDIIHNISGTNAIAMTYDDAVNFLQTQGTSIASVEVSIKGAAVQWTDAEPFIDANGRTMVPLRAVADAMGLTVNWDGSAREAIFTKGTKTIYFPIDSTTARTSTGQSVQMDTAAVIKNDRTYAPIRYLAEFFGYTVSWGGATRTVSIK